MIEGQQLVLDDAVYPESPRWRDGELWFSDVHAFTVRKLTAAGHVRTVFEVPGRPAGLGFLPDGRLLVASALDRCIWVWNGYDLTMVADLSDMTTGLLNDMVVDGRGRAFVGDTGFDLMAGDEARPGQVIRIEQDPAGGGFHAEVATFDVEFPNGAAVSEDGRTYWVAETSAHRISRFTISADGQLLQRVTLIELPDMPDGLCLDEGGAVWVAMLRLGEFWHVGSDGLVDRKISAEGRLAVACVLGGADRSSLFLCTADTTFEQLARGVSRGLVHSVQAEPGAGYP